MKTFVHIHKIAISTFLQKEFFKNDRINYIKDPKFYTIFMPYISKKKSIPLFEKIQLTTL